MAYNKLPETILLQLYKHLGRQQPRLFSLVFLVNSYRQYLFFTFKLIKPYSALLVTSDCTLRTKDSLCVLVLRFCISRKGGTGGGDCSHANPYMDRLRKRYSHLVEGSFLAGRIAWALSGCLTTENTDYCMVVNDGCG